MRFLTSFGMTGSDLMDWGEGSRGVLNKIYSMKKSSCKTPRLPSPLHYKFTVIPNAAKTELAKVWRNEESFW